TIHPSFGLCIVRLVHRPLKPYLRLSNVVQSAHARTARRNHDHSDPVLTPELGFILLPGLDSLTAVLERAYAVPVQLFREDRRELLRLHESNHRLILGQVIQNLPEAVIERRYTVHVKVDPYL